MKTISRSLFLLCLSLFPLISVGQNASGDATEAINQLFEVIPIEQRLAEPPQELHDLFSQNPFDLQSSQNEKVLSLFQEAFLNDSLLSSVHKSFLEKYNAGSADSTLQWIQKESTQQVLETEKEFYTLQGIRKRVVHKYELEQNPPSDDRTDLIQSMVQNMADPQSVVESRTTIFRSMLSALNETNGQQLFNNMQMEGIVSNYQSQLESQINQELANQFLVMYHDLNNETLENYNSFYESEAGNWFSATTSKSIQSAYESAADRFLKSVQNL